MKAFTHDFAALSDDADGIAQSQTPGGAGNLTLNGALVSSGTGVMTEAQIITVTSAADDTSVTFTITGTDSDAVSVSESFLGANASTATSTGYFKTVTQIAVDGATTGAVTVGPVAADGAASPTVVSKLVPFRYNQSLFVDIPGTLTATVEHTATNNLQTFTNSLQADSKWRATTGVTTVTTDASANIAFPVRAVRMIITSYTSGTCSFTSIQST